MTLQKVYKTFPSEESCLTFLESAIWPEVVNCPYCKGTYTTVMPSEFRHHCNSCNRSFSVTVGTIFHKTKCDLQKWFYLIVIYINSHKLPSVRQLGQELGVTKDTALRMCKKINTAYLNNKPLLDKIIKAVSNE
jgi:transposase-like protein